MGNDKNQKVLTDAIMKALDDVELEGVSGGISKRTVAEIAGAVVGAAVLVKAVSAKHKLDSSNADIKFLADQNEKLLEENESYRYQNKCLNKQIEDLKEAYEWRVERNNELKNEIINSNKK